MENVFLAEGARIVGNVKIGSGSSIWYNAVLRGDLSPVVVGQHSNIQDNSTLHVHSDLPCIVGDYVTIGHNSIVHGCTIEDNVLVGMGACILNGAVIGKNSIIGAKALVTENMIVPPNSLVLGIPGKVIRRLSEEEIKSIKKNAMDYEKLWKNKDRLKK